MHLNFSHAFQGAVWNSALALSNEILVVEVRDAERRRVSFSAVDLTSGRLLWDDLTFDELWWISLNAAQGHVAIFTYYSETDNPDKKAVIAYDIVQRQILWWKNDFSLSELGGNCVAGIASKYGHQRLVLDLNTGGETAFVPPPPETGVARPVQYAEGHPYFKTVKTFLQSRFNLNPVVSLEYLEHDGMIIISCYTRETELSNDLFIVSAQGELLLQEKLATQLKGIGQDTFFICGGSVIFVRNKKELFSYTRV